MIEPDFERLSEALDRFSLPFVSGEDMTLQFWDVALEETRHDQSDFAIGEEFANLATRAAKECGVAFLLALILRDMVRAGSFGPMEAGFIVRVAELTRLGALD